MSKEVEHGLRSDMIHTTSWCWRTVVEGWNAFSRRCHGSGSHDTLISCLRHRAEMRNPGPACEQDFARPLPPMCHGTRCRFIASLLLSSPLNHVLRISHVGVWQRKITCPIIISINRRPSSEQDSCTLSHILRLL